MEGEESIVVYGMWASPFSNRVELALKVKGIPYVYVEEDLLNKSQMLLKYNPVYKKIPVLVHNGKPIIESLIILEYIEDTWRNSGPKLLPDDPLQKALVRIWVDFIHHQFNENMKTLVKTEGETQKKVLDKIHELLKVLDEGLKGFYPNGTTNICNENLGLLDIVGASVFCPIKATEDLFGLKIIDPEKTPLVYSWVESLKGLSLVKETIPPYDKLLQIVSYYKQKNLNFSAA
ncbi:hypothetical protein FEM48_Zijuj06G0171900 [Ziziphus jujuba var. spinosa]|uniref:Glutathione S-transferase n=1 Tax=Ziziphus jujuba var. spinosa TaxID=714518 RepID=A0A978VAJ9_ZIZJJ|nr:hypothetical protein FEM48_Zijuj06G0171900 [Ziziphus jujuba var. spinosa]